MCCASLALPPLPTSSSLCPAPSAAATRSTIAAIVVANAGSSIAAWTASRESARYSLTGAIAVAVMTESLPLCPGATWPARSGRVKRDFAARPRAERRSDRRFSWTVVGRLPRLAAPSRPGRDPACRRYARRMRLSRQSAPPIRSRETPSDAPGLPRLRLADTSLPDAAIAALFPDCAIERERPARAAAQGVPFVQLAQRLLRAPPPDP